MGNLARALQELRTERKQTQLQLEKLDQTISVIQSLNGSATIRSASQPTRIISAASWRKRKKQDGQSFAGHHSQQLYRIKRTQLV